MVSQRSTRAEPSSRWLEARKSLHISYLLTEEVHLRVQLDFLVVAFFCVILTNVYIQKVRKKYDYSAN